MYKKALKEGYVYSSCRGNLSTEDLFRLPLTSRSGFDLDTVAKTIAKDIKAFEETSFVEVGDDNELQKLAEAKLEIVKDVIADKIADRDAKKEAKVKAERKQKILELLASKRDEALANKSEEELLAELEKL